MRLFLDLRREARRQHRLLRRIVCRADEVSGHNPAVSSAADRLLPRRP